MMDREKVMKEIIIAYDETEASPVIGDWVGELVRCADCRHAEVSQSGLIKCRGIFRSREWYCADGERK